jgi:hypothetical protein
VKEYELKIDSKRQNLEFLRSLILQNKNNNTVDPNANDITDATHDIAMANDTDEQQNSIHPPQNTHNNQSNIFIN